MRSFLKYVLLRLIVFAACFLVLNLLFGEDASPWLIALLALVFTSGLSLLLLRRQAEVAGEALSTGVASVRRRMEETRRREDGEPPSHDD